MKLTALIPVIVKVISYRPAIAGHYSGLPEDSHPSEGAEIEFEVSTLAGSELSESDFGEKAWKELCAAVLDTHEEAIDEARSERRISDREWEADR